MKLQQKGIGSGTILLIIAVVCFIVFSGWYIATRNRDDSPQDTPRTESSESNDSSSNGQYPPEDQPSNGYEYEQGR